MSRDRFGDYSNIRRRPAGQVDLAIVPPKRGPGLLVVDEAADVSPETAAAFEAMKPAKCIVIGAETKASPAFLALCGQDDVYSDGPVS